jgi:hypothetical protein
MAPDRGGALRTLVPTRHTLANASIAERRLQVIVRIAPERDGACRVEVAAATKRAQP